MEEGRRFVVRARHLYPLLLLIDDANKRLARINLSIREKLYCSSGNNNTSPIQQRSVVPCSQAPLRHRPP